MGGNSRKSQAAPVGSAMTKPPAPAQIGGGFVGGAAAPTALNPTAWSDAERAAGGRWELPQAPAGSVQGIAKNFVAPPPPPREQLAQAMAYPTLAESIHTARTLPTGTGQAGGLYNNNSIAIRSRPDGSQYAVNRSYKGGKNSR